MNPSVSFIQSRVSWFLVSITVLFATLRVLGSWSSEKVWEKVNLASALHARAGKQDKLFGCYSFFRHGTAWHSMMSDFEMA